MLKYTLVPEGFFSQADDREILSRVAILERNDSVKRLELPCYKAVLLYTGDDVAARRLASQLEAASHLDQYNKVMVHLGDDSVDIVVAAGDRLLLCNSYPASDGVTAQYFIFAALREFQINPAVTTVHFFGDTDDSVKGDLFRYFASVEVL
ncbi:MAG: DUF3822 family protein [Bacteroidales bacterium]|nr:DUF3822 family protein [Bacteroidales bacterium]